MAILWGCGEYLKRILPIIENKIDISFICDANTEKQKAGFGKYQCFPIREILDHKEEIVYITVIKDELIDEIRNNLTEWGIEHRHINSIIQEEAERWAIDDPIYKDFIEDQGKRILLIGAPGHKNLGDQAQTYCFELLACENYPERKVYTFEGRKIRDDYYLLLDVVKSHIRDDDLIALHSGYHCTDLFYREELLIEKVLEYFPDHHITLLPQTVRFIDENKLDRSIRRYQQHRNLIFYCRDAQSYEFAQKHYLGVDVRLMPDLVMSLIGRRKYVHKRKGILLCLRKLDEQESLFSYETKYALAERLSKYDDVTITDTESRFPMDELRSDRARCIEETLEYYSRFSLVITDRYHGMIFSAVSGTPFIALSSSDHKIESGVQWFEKCGNMDRTCFYKITREINVDDLDAVCGRYFCEMKGQDKYLSDKLYKDYFKDFKVW